MSKRPNYLIETDELAAELQAGKNIKVVDGTWLPDQDGNLCSQYAAELFLKSRLTNDTVHFDIWNIVEPGSDLLFRFPSQEVFATHMKKLGIQKTQSIVVYDQSPGGLFTAARVAYMLRHYGATNVRLLNGGMKKWKAEGRTVVSGTVEDPVFKLWAGGDYSYAATDSSRVIMDIGTMHGFAGKLYKADDAASLDFQVVDARDAPGFSSANIKNSVNVPFDELLNADGTFKSNEDLEAYFAAKSVDTGK